MMTSVRCPVYPAGQDVRSEYGFPAEAPEHSPENGSLISDSRRTVVFEDEEPTMLRAAEVGGTSPHGRPAKFAGTRLSQPFPPYPAAVRELEAHVPNHDAARIRRDHPPPERAILDDGAAPPAKGAVRGGAVTDGDEPQRRPDHADVYDSNRDRKELHICDFRGVPDNPALMVRDTCGGRNRQRVTVFETPAVHRAAASPVVQTRHGAVRDFGADRAGCRRCGHIERHLRGYPVSRVDHPFGVREVPISNDTSAAGQHLPADIPDKNPQRAGESREVPAGAGGTAAPALLKLFPGHSELPSGLFQKFFGNKASNLAETRHLLMLAIERKKRRSGEAAGPPPDPQAGDVWDGTWAARTSRSPSSPRGGTEHRSPCPAHDLGLAVSPIFPEKGERHEERETGPAHPSQRGADTPPHFLRPSAYNHYLEHCAEAGPAGPGRSRTATGESAASGGAAGARAFAAMRPGSATIYRPSLQVHTTPEDLLEMLRSSERKKGADGVHAAAEAARRIGVIVVPGTGYLPHKGGETAAEVQGAAAKKTKAKKKKKKRVWQQRRGPAPAHSFEKDADDLDF
ncbi:MAG: hypothetical protein BJ554DRAFT_4291 [Olpidium bornovanus]|uniref:Uncharacterized protein n=1 Tax=Olpidium bornovanus TaxID=278681 RepID=A0A8H7ZMF6_9FUNG|nr:MAG: hypothetical protein BJ554DRAFT_4291 [Olpidium bornovanus]